jgi:SAM-dependent methyltransferase
MLDTVKRKVRGGLRRCRSWLSGSQPVSAQAAEFDAANDVETEAVVTVDALDPGQSATTANASNYQATSPQVFQQMMDELSDDLASYVFIDVGSGKGRTLLLATRYPFHEILGIEYFQDLHNVAVQNLARFVERTQFANRIESIHADGSTFEFPNRNLVCFLANPFGGPVLRRFLDNLETTLRNNGRNAYLVYYNPKHRHVIARSGPWESIVRRGHRWQDVLREVWQNVPSYEIFRFRI